MQIKILKTGSEGNGYIITDNTNQSLVIEAGVPLKYVLGNADNVIGFIYSHKHNDHSKYKNDYKNAFDFYDTPEHYIMGNVGNYNIWTFPVLHDVENKGFIIANKIEKKIMFFATDLIYNSLVKVFYRPLFDFVKNIDFDLFAIESNYTEYEYKCAIKSENSSVYGVKNHLSNYECARFLSHLCNRNKVQNILLIHGSNRIGRSIKGKKQPILNLIPKAEINIAGAGMTLNY